MSLRFPAAPRIKVQFIRSSLTIEIAVILVVISVIAGSLTAVNAASDPLATRVLAADSSLFPELSTKAADLAFKEISNRAKSCRSIARGTRAGCVVRSLFEVVPIAPVAEPSRAEDSTMTLALAEGRGSCAAIVAVALAAAEGADVDLYAWVRGEHVVVAAPNSDGYFELLEGGRFHPWKLSAAGTAPDERGTRVSTREYFGYYLDNLAVRLAAANDAARAEVAFNRAISSTPRAARIRFNYGTFLLNGKRTSDAIVQLKRSVRLDGSNADARTNLGVAWAQLGNSTKAQRAFEKALRVDPRNASARRNLDALTSGVRPGSPSPAR